MPFKLPLDSCLALSSRSTPALTISESSRPIAPDRACEELSSWESESGATWLRICRTASGFHLSFPEYVDMLVSSDGARVVFHRKPGAPSETIEHLLVDKAIPLVLSLSDNSVLHCSAVVSPGGALVFTGKTGQGKSTLAASFAMRGFPLITDDSLLLQSAGSEIMALPSGPSLRLWPEDVRHFEPLGAEISDVAHYTSKKRLRLDGRADYFAQKPVGTLAMYVLSDAAARPDGPTSQNRAGPDEDGAIAIDKLSPREGFLELVQNSIQLDTIGRDSLKALSERLAMLANRIPAFRLSYRRDHALLPRVVNSVLAHAASLRPAGIERRLSTITPES